ncbi:MAG: hypothetical protein IV093_07785 [Rubrivivax sp.]|nr:hypothetical protein [Rubrivivax sp.]
MKRLTSAAAGLCPQRLLLLPLLLPLLLLAACGGAEQAAPTAAPLVATVTLSGRAVDGPLQGASACYDLDDDGACGAGEPRSAPSDADGRWTLEVPASSAGRHAVVVEVPAEAIDADTAAPVGRAFVMHAPATGQAGPHSVFVSPLSTLVQAGVVLARLPLAEATLQVQQDTGLALSPLADFTLDSSAAGRQAAQLARLVQLTQLAQSAALDALPGTPDRNGLLLTAADVQREVQITVLTALPVLADALADALAQSGLGTSTGAALHTGLQTLATALAAQIGPDAATLRLASSMRALAEPPAPATPEASAQLAALRFTDVNNWFMRSFRSGADDTVADAEGWVRYQEHYMSSAGNNFSANGVAKGWAGNSNPDRAGDLHWNGSDWVTCDPAQRSRNRVRDALGRHEYEFCNGREAGRGIRRAEDIAGQSLQAVLRDKIRTFPGGSGSVLYKDWGPVDLGLLGPATFPPGSLLYVQSNTTTSTAPTYDVRSSNQVLLYNANVAAGGDVREDSQLACNDPAQTADAARTSAGTLEQVVARATGKPCVYAANGVSPDLSLDPDEWWGAGTLNLGDLANTNTLPANTGNYYTTTATLRVGFSGPGSRVTFYRCYRKTSTNGPRNCSVIGRGSYSIQTLGTARVLSFTTAPALAQRLGYARVLVERGGAVYYGFKNPVGVATTSLRLNLVAANALLAPLGMPPIRPTSLPGSATGERAAALATLKGVWGAADTTDATVFRFGDNGRFFLAEAKAFRADTREQSGSELGWFDIDPATGRIATQLELDSTLTAGTSHGDSGDDERFTVTPDTLSVGPPGSNVSIGRLGNDAAGLVGLWARGSATDLSVQHFAFFANGRVMAIGQRAGDGSSCTAADAPPGVEYASWSFDPATGQLRLFGKVHDTDGCEGIFDSSAAGVAAGIDNLDRLVTIVLASDGNSFDMPGVDGRPTLTWYRIPVR